MDAAKDIVGVKNGSLLLVQDEKTYKLQFYQASGKNMGQLKDIDLPPGVGISGFVAKTGEAVISDDVAKDPRWYGSVSEKLKLPIQSMASFPLVIDKKVIGVVQFLDKADGSTFNKTDIDIFTLGFKRRGVWWMGDNLEKDSGLFDALVEDNISAIRKYCEATGLAPWHGPKRVGFFRYFVVRKSYKTDHLLFNLVTTSYDLPKFDLNAFSRLLQDIFKDRFAGLLHSINDETGDRTLATAGTSKLISGKDKIVEELLGLNFEISMKSFFQTNPKSAEKLYAKVIEYALENKEAIDNTIVMDLFCGTGTIGQILASRSTNAKIIGVDIVASAIKDAIQNAKRNNISGLEFYTADVGKFLYEHPQYKNKIRTIILDPSRAGIAPKTLLKIIAINADRIVYVSCNPATQARDTAEMMKYGYEIKKISLVDQFPHTSHIETVVLFEKI